MAENSQSHVVEESGAGPEFRSDATLPDSYLANLLVLFILLIGLGLVVARLWQRRARWRWLIRLGKDQSSAHITRRLSHQTRLHLVDVEGRAILVVEGTAGVAIHELGVARSSVTSVANATDTASSGDSNNDEEDR